MTRKTYSFNIEQDIISRLDAIVISPVSRSDVLNDLLEYALQNKYVLESFVNNNLNIMKSRVDTIERQSNHVIQWCYCRLYAIPRPITTLQGIDLDQYLLNQANTIQ